MKIIKHKNKVYKYSLVKTRQPLKWFGVKLKLIEGKNIWTVKWHFGKETEREEFIKDEDSFIKNLINRFIGKTNKEE